MKRKPQVAGTFYPGNREELLSDLREMTDPNAVKKEALAVIVPHAGYVYSGPVAGAVFSSVEIPGTAVILGPGHRDIRPLFAVQKKGSWLTPLGEVPIREDLAAGIIEQCPLAREDDEAHRGEHSLEVEVPFLQYFREDVGIVPVCVSHRADYGDLESFGRGLAAAIRACERPALIVASTDMSHYVGQRTAEKKDALAIRKILDLDARGLYEIVLEEDISMCGFQPAAAALVAARELGACEAELVLYRTSGDSSGDYSQVVGYAGLRILPGPGR
jgi:AmmeMemoRadiSam system protein B